MSRKASRIMLIATAACALALPFALFGCGSSPAAAPSGDTPAQESKSDETQAPETSADEADPVDADQHAPVPEDETDESYRAKWESKARSFLTVYPVNYVRTSADEEPIFMTMEDWASNCLSYLDPDCELAHKLQDDPEPVGISLGFYDVAQVVDSTEVVATDDTSVTVEITEEVTQQGWDYTNETVRTFRVTFGDKALITGVEELS